MNIFRSLFPEPEVTLVKREIINLILEFEDNITYHSLGYYRTLKDIKTESVKSCRNTQKIVTCISKNNMHPKEVALNLVIRVTIHFLNTGNYSNPLGTLSSEGRDLIKIANYCMSRLKDLGYISESDSKEFDSEIIKFTIPSSLRAWF